MPSKRRRLNTAARRDEFTKRTCGIVARRAGYICSYPGCRIPTIGPRSDADDRTVLTGEACHIRGASPEGPRYDAKQSPALRASVGNAIWMCKLHARAIDVDKARFTVDALARFKCLHEQMVSAAQLGFADINGRLRRRAGGPSYDDILSSISLTPTRAHDMSPRRGGLTYEPPSAVTRRKIRESITHGYWVQEELTPPLLEPHPSVKGKAYLGRCSRLAYEDACWRRRTFVIVVNQAGITIDLGPANLCAPHHLANFIEAYVAVVLGVWPDGNAGNDEGIVEFFYGFEPGSLDAVCGQIPIVVSWLRDKMDTTAGRSRSFRRT